MLTGTPLVDCPVRMGDKVNCEVTQVKGIVTCINIWLNGCVKIGIQPPGLTQEGKNFEEFWVPVQNVKVIKKAKVKAPQPEFLQAIDTPEVPPKKTTGGPQRDQMSCVKDAPG